ncbi:MAG: lipoyl(octanoyl) transferase LipB [Pseudomonadales bacterium]|nr:lipoyl(octanoyl) transferase LipB [Pseudomonadales bacterium]
MQAFTRQRVPGTQDQLWLLEHAPVYTLGQGADVLHLLNSQNISVVRSDRGGQVTYHGPGQLMFYLLADLRALGIGVRALVESLEQAVIALLSEFDIAGSGDRAAPGVYVEGAKIAALGLRVSRGCCYHGLCFNYQLDLSPFSGINPCGYENLPVTDLATLLAAKPQYALPTRQVLAARLTEQLRCKLNYQATSQVQLSWPHPSIEA